MGTPLQVAIYSRVSTAQQDDQGQYDELVALCQRSGWTIAKVYREKVSGTKSADARPELKRLLIEAKRGSLAMHYRMAPELEPVVLGAMQEAVDASPGVTLLRGKMVAEAKPGGASKGQAIEDFLQERPFSGRRPVFIGDDVTDEAGFLTVQRLGGIGIKVGDGASVAAGRLADPPALRRELEALVALLMSRTA